MGNTMTDQRRAFDFSLDLDATPDEVWRTLTEAEELVRWFPLEARVTPGRGGTMFWSWATPATGGPASTRGSRAGCSVSSRRTPGHTTPKAIRSPRARSSPLGSSWSSRSRPIAARPA